MGVSALGLFFLISLLALSDAYDGTKGNYRRPPEAAAGTTFPASENGTCYKRMPYDQAVSANATGHVQLVPGTYQGVKQDNRVWVTVLDCCEGYERNATTGKCETHCDEGCVGGKCTGPNICTCEEGWSAEQGVCKPQCRSPCPRDAYCFSPDVCQCKFGYEEDAYQQCKPVCPGNCTNGECIAPRVCRCRRGYMLNERQECMPICEGGCSNGECTYPGVCDCHPGFINPPGDRESCVSESGSGSQNSQCKNGCPNGQCVGPEQCVCNYGFRMDPRTRTCVSSHIESNPYNHDPYNTDRPGSDPYNRDLYSANRPGSDHYNRDPYSANRPGSDHYNRDPHSTERPGSDPYNRDPHSTQSPGSDHYNRDQHSTERPALDPYNRDPYSTKRPGYDHYNRDPHNTERPRPDSHNRDPYNIERPGTDSYNRDAYTTERPKVGNRYTPYCRTGCPNGVCVGPDQCHCYRPFHLDPVTQACVISDETNKETTTLRANHQDSNRQCSTGCPNGRCVGPNICVCNEGFVIDQRTQMCVDYWSAQSTTSTTASSRDSSLCRNGCRYGQCVGVDQCICNPGYKMDLRTQTCKPYYSDSTDSHRNRVESGSQYGQLSQCRDGCPNGQCIGPNQCICNSGYELDSRTQICRPFSTNNPQYPQTPYPDASGRPSSLCRDGCRNGQCVGRDQCICNPGYQKDPRTQICVLESTTQPQNSHTYYPDLSNVHNDMSQCPDGCRNGQCVGPYQCVCNPGYRMDPRTQTCSLLHSSSSGPQNSNSQPNTSSLCRNGCRYGQCIAPDQCICNRGYRMDEQTQTCKPHYGASPDNRTVTSHRPDSSGQYGPSSQCTDGCRNGQCVGPNQCICNSGYRQDPRTGICTYYGEESSHVSNENPENRQSNQCRNGCHYGQCIGPDQCVCNPGYRMDPRTQTCRPYSNPDEFHRPTVDNRYHQSHQCQNGCHNGQCVGPNQCVCNPGYQMDPNTQICVLSYNSNPHDTSSSEPNNMYNQPSYSGNNDPHRPRTSVRNRYGQPHQCQNGCQNGQCVGPNQCVCNPGYQMDSRTQSCIPSYGTSSHDPYGSSSPESNTTYNSYQCRDGCPNGRCVGLNQCVCNRGYIMNPRTQLCISSRGDESWGVENPNPAADSDHSQNSPFHCRDNCPNGQCIGPNQCVCNPGFRVYPSTNKCVPIHNLNEGTWGNPTDDNNASQPLCDEPCLNGYCTGRNQCTCIRNYVNDAQDPNKCMPVCHGCINGTCTAPNHCVCNPGYAKDRSVKGSQRCIPIQ